ncbi:hypothetical protein FN846DRAFT_895470 [Sphaerosporella brunnea]|uniref:Uncharacterized protein n=1 Tax=Sphaerosporella brunnea TaxID=1250544 RepID=A0A5J5EGD8_9PEZI|nr:hypothetical protein FN846DRAFT_895470 [Sphaerosporella brunnea]
MRGGGLRIMVGAHLAFIHEAPDFEHISASSNPAMDMNPNPADQSSKPSQIAGIGKAKDGCPEETQRPARGRKLAGGEVAAAGTQEEIVLIIRSHENHGVAKSPFRGDGGLRVPVPGVPAGTVVGLSTYEVQGYVLEIFPTPCVSMETDSGRSGGQDGYSQAQPQPGKAGGVAGGGGDIYQFNTNKPGDAGNKFGLETWKMGAGKGGGSLSTGSSR